MEQSCSLLFSCEDIKEQNEIDENEISSPTSLPLAASSVEFLALTESSKENSLLANECDCSFKILDVDLPPLSGTNQRNIVELYSYENCSGPAACPLFTTYYTSDGLCIVPFGNCHQDWDDLMEDYQPFNCLIDAFAGFYKFDFAAYQSPSNCNANNPDNPEITISIRCEKVGSPSCGGTDINIYTVPISMLYETGYYVTGGECGCVPHFLKFENPENPSEGT